MRVVQGFAIAEQTRIFLSKLPWAGETRDCRRINQTCQARLWMSSASIVAMVDHDGGSRGADTTLRLRIDQVHRGRRQGAGVRVPGCSVRTTSRAHQDNVMTT